jgi:hypothetical protein
MLLSATPRAPSRPTWNVAEVIADQSFVDMRTSGAMPASALRYEERFEAEWSRYRSDSASSARIPEHHQPVRRSDGTFERDWGKRYPSIRGGACSSRSAARPTWLCRPLSLLSGRRSVPAPLHALVPFSRTQAAPLAYRCRGRRLHERLGLHSPPSVLPPIPELREGKCAQFVKFLMTTAPVPLCCGTTQGRGSATWIGSLRGRRNQSPTNSSRVATAAATLSESLSVDKLSKCSR